MCVIKCFGITQDPDTHNYALVLQYLENGDLRNYLKRTADSITWDQRLNKIFLLKNEFVNNSFFKYKIINFVDKFF